MDGDLFGASRKLKRTMGGHQSPRAGTDVWLTPPHVIDALGGASMFDLDPCAAPPPRPWDTAKAHFDQHDNGLMRPWSGRIWLNPPYGETGKWLTRLADHGDGVALIFARTETEMFFECVWGRASAILFLFGRLNFCRPNGTRAKANSGAPSVLVAYGEAEAERLRNCSLPGKWVRL